MNKFMGGLTLGIVLTACFFIFFNPFQKKAAIPASPVIAEATDSLKLSPLNATKDSLALFNPLVLQSRDKINRDSLVSFAKSMLGTPYLYGSIDPAKGFDCSGFIVYVFNHFKIVVPRSSHEFEHLGVKKSLNNCRPGDVILFTGTNPLERTIGHIGIVSDTYTVNPSFIHSSSGKAAGVTITNMDSKFYQDRFIAVIDLLTL